MKPGDGMAVGSSSSTKEERKEMSRNWEYPGNSSTWNKERLPVAGYSQVEISACSGKAACSTWNY